MKSVKVRSRKRKNGLVTLFLDIYDGGLRRQESTNLFLKAGSSQSIKESNRRTKEKAEKLAAEKNAELHRGELMLENLDGSELTMYEWIEECIHQRHTPNKDNWSCMLIHLKAASHNQDKRLSRIDKTFVLKFRSYLLGGTKANGVPFSQNTKHSYFNKFKAAIKEAHNNGLLRKNPFQGVDNIPAGDSKREYLTEQEYLKLKETDCRIPVLKNAFLFSCMTGIRFGDLTKMKWKDLREEDGKYMIKFQQSKTGSHEYLPVTTSAVNSYLGTREADEHRLFSKLRYSAWYNQLLREWVMRAGITKEITFHCARHTYATMLLSKGTAITTVSKLLGHKHLSTTLIYAKIIDESKNEAVNQLEGM